MEITLNGVKVQVEDEWTILDAAKFYGVNIPTLCYHEDFHLMVLVVYV